MILSQATANFMGMSLDTCIDHEHNSYATLTSVAKALGISRQNTQDWVTRNNKQAEGVEITVGVRKVKVKAYPVRVIMEFLHYRMDLGDKKVIALVFKAVEDSLRERAMTAVSEANK